jgi:hypothetical protein
MLPRACRAAGTPRESYWAGEAALRAVHRRSCMSMSEIDERRIAEIAKEPPRVLRSAPDGAAREEAHRIVETMALMRKQRRGTGAAGVSPEGLWGSRPLENR